MTRCSPCSPMRRNANSEPTTTCGCCSPTPASMRSRALTGWPTCQGRGHVHLRYPHHQAGDERGLGGQHGQAARHRGQRDADHAGAVLAADRQHGDDRDDRLAGLDASEAELGGVRPAAAGRAGRRGEQQPAGAGQCPQLGPLCVQRVGEPRTASACRVTATGAGRASPWIRLLPGCSNRLAHASLRLSTYAGAASAIAVQAHSTAKPVQGASGKSPADGM